MRTGRVQVDELLREYEALGREPGVDELSLLEAALFLEESFGIRLRDEDMTAEAMGTIARMRELVSAKLGGA
jgi:acyl carrier protein